MVTAPVDYIASSIKAGEHSKGVVEIVVITKAIESFQQEEGKFPQTLDELVEKSHLKVMPNPPAMKQFEYNPATGIVKLVPKSQ